MSRTTTWTAPDGTKAKRTSKSRVYTHVVVVKPATREARAAAFERVAAEHEAHAERLEAAAAAGKTHLRDRRLGSWGNQTPEENFHTHEVDLLGTEVAHSNGRGTYCEVYDRANYRGEAQTWRKFVPEGVAVIRDGETDFSGEVMVVISAHDYVIAEARNRAASLRERADAARQEVVDQPEDPSKPGVVRWSSSRDLATKALPEFSYYATQYGQTLHVEEVDAS
jgi:hypothetical protein